MHKTNNEQLKDVISTHSCPTTLRVLANVRRVASNSPSILGLNPRYAAEVVDPKAVLVRELMECRW